MKKLMTILALVCSMNVSAQWFVSGTAGFGYLSDCFQMYLRPSVGYEFTDRWAAGIGLGMGVQTPEVYGIFDPFVRFNCWNNKKLFIDIKAKTMVFVGSEWNAANIGFGRWPATSACLVLRTTMAIGVPPLALRPPMRNFPSSISSKGTDYNHTESNSGRHSMSAALFLSEQ